MEYKKEDLDLEKKLLASMVLNEDALRIIADKTTKEFFYHEYCRNLYLYVSEYYRKYSTIPSKDLFIKFLEEKIYDKDKIKDIIMFITQLRKNKINIQEVNFVIEQLAKYKLLRDYLLTLDKYTQNINISNIKNIYENLENDLSKIKEEVKIKDLRRFEVNSRLVDRIMRYSDVEIKNEFKIPSGYSMIDEKIGGWRLSWLIVVTAESGAGKSITLLNLAENANLLGDVDVVYISLEQPYEEFLDRYHALITGIDHDIIHNKSFTREQKREFFFKIARRSIVKEQHLDFKKWFFENNIENEDNLMGIIKDIDNKFTKVKQKFYFLDIPRNCNVSVIEKELRQIKKFCDPKVVVIDYINIMEPLTKTGIFGYDHGNISRELKGLAREMNLTIVTASQMLITKDERLGLDKIKYARMIAENADYVLMFKQDEDDELMNRIRMRLVKHRHSKDMTVTLRQEFGKMKLSNYKEVD